MLVSSSLIPLSAAAALHAASECDNELQNLDEYLQGDKKYRAANCDLISTPT